MAQASTPTERETLESRIKKFVNDVVTLDVLTLTGDITLVADQFDSTKKTFDWDTLFTNIAAKMKVADASKLDVVAYTHAEWDMDSVNFVRKELSVGDKTLIESHHAAVEAAQKSRFEAVRIVAGLLGAKLT
jgi:hypothetical protein